MGRPLKLVYVLCCSSSLSHLQDLLGWDASRADLSSLEGPDHDESACGREAEKASQQPSFAAPRGHCNSIGSICSCDSCLQVKLQAFTVADAGLSHCDIPVRLTDLQIAANVPVFTPLGMLVWQA